MNELDTASEPRASDPWSVAPVTTSRFWGASSAC